MFVPVATGGDNPGSTEDERFKNVHNTDQNWNLNIGTEVPVPKLQQSLVHTQYWKLRSFHA